MHQDPIVGNASQQFLVGPMTLSQPLVYKESWDLVARVIKRQLYFYLLITPTKVLVDLLTKSHDPPSTFVGDPR